MALSQNYNQPLFEAASQVKLDVIAASTTLYAGTLCMNDAGVAKVYTAAGYAAGAKLLGYPTSTVANSTGSDVTLAAPIMFRRGCPMVVAAKSGDEPDASDVGGNVFLKDNFSAGATDAGTDLAVVLLEVWKKNDSGTATHLLIKLP